MLEIEKERLDQIKLFLQNEQTELEKQRQEYEAARKIETIAAGILRKNYRFVRQLEEIETRAKELIPRMNHAQDQMSKAASLIADAILFEPEAVQLVACSTGNNLEMEKDWEMMSEFDKDEFIRRKIIREL